jgi:hypothetical protein
MKTKIAIGKDVRRCQCGHVLSYGIIGYYCRNCGATQSGRHTPEKVGIYRLPDSTRLEARNV